MKNIFNVTFTGEPKLVLNITYQNGKLVQIKGLQNITRVIYEWLPYIAPVQEKNLDLNLEKDLHKLKGRMQYNEVVKEKSLMTKITESWFFFFEKKFGFQPIFRGIEGKAVNGIIAYLRKVCNDDSEVFLVWENILDRWDELDMFTQSKCELTYINSKIAIILTQLKNTDYDRKV